MGEGKRKRKEKTLSMNEPIAMGENRQNSSLVLSSFWWLTDMIIYFTLFFLKNGAFEFLPRRFGFARIGFGLIHLARSDVPHQVEKHL